VSSTITATLMLHASSTSIRGVGSGTKITNTLQMIPIGKIRSWIRESGLAAGSDIAPEAKGRNSGCTVSDSDVRILKR
jgi:hypothetical protein